MKNISKILSLFEYKILWPLLFTIYRAIYKTDDKTILFADPYSPDLTENMKPLFAALEDEGGFKLLKCFPSQVSGNKVQVRLSRSLSYIRFLKGYAKCKALFLTESYLPAYAVKRPKDKEVVQLWHGSGAFKKWGYSTIDKSFGADKESAETFPMHNCYTLVCVSSQEVIPHYSEAFNCPREIIKPLGIPKTDILFDCDFLSRAKQELYYKIPELQHEFTSYEEFSKKRIILYAPTFRGSNVTAAKSGIQLDFSKLALQIKEHGNDTVFLVKLHPFVSDNIKDDIKDSDSIFNVSGVDTNICIAAADLLITDYSSIIFEYSMLGRPAIFYAYDLKSYEGERDFYYPYKDFVPGCIAGSEEELLSKLFDDHIDNRTLEFSKKFMSACDGNSTKRIIEYFRNTI